MISAQKLFSDHTAHLALYELLRSAIEELELYRNHCLLDEGREIEALSLSRMPLSDLPRIRSGKSPTERVADRLSAIQEGNDIAEKKRQLATIIQYLHLYDTIITVFTEREKWFVEEFFVRGRNGGVKIADWYIPKRQVLSPAQFDFLVKLSQSLQGEDARIMEAIISQLTGSFQTGV